MSAIDRDSAIRTAKAILREAGVSLEELATMPLTWHLEEDQADSLRQFIGDSEPAPITLSVGPAKREDGSETYGLRCWNSDYPEEGYILLRESGRPELQNIKRGEAAPDKEPDPLDRFPKPLKGYERSWVACKVCSNIAYYDFIPYSLSNPTLTLMCGHQGGQKFSDAVDYVTEDEARAFYRLKSDKTKV